MGMSERITSLSKYHMCKTTFKSDHKINNPSPLRRRLEEEDSANMPIWSEVHGTSPVLLSLSQSHDSILPSLLF